MRVLAHASWLEALCSRLCTHDREDERPRKKKKKKTGGKMLSFAMDDEEEGDGDEGETSGAWPFVHSRGVVLKRADELYNAERTAKKVSKDPSVNTSFLPDREREEAERKVRDELRKEWLRKQEEMKAEEIEITCTPSSPLLTMW